MKNCSLTGLKLNINDVVETSYGPLGKFLWKSEPIIFQGSLAIVPQRVENLITKLRSLPHELHQI